VRAGDPADGGDAERGAGADVSDPVTVQLRLHANQVVGLRLVAAGHADKVQRAQLKMFAGRNLAEWCGKDERGRKQWRLTAAGQEVLDGASDVTVPNVPRSPMPASGYYVDRVRR